MAEQRRAGLYRPHLPRAPLPRRIYGHLSVVVLWPVQVDHLQLRGNRRHMVGGRRLVRVGWNGVSVGTIPGTSPLPQYTRADDGSWAKRGVNP